MTNATLPPSPESPPGRRVLVACVTGEVGERIQRWRLEHDPEQARRLPPHTTLCYWAPELSERLDAQVRHAFPRAITVQLGRVQELGNADRTFYVELRDTARLNLARERLYDGAHIQLPRLENWTWHVTCVRYGARRDPDELRRLTSDFRVDAPWTIDRLALLELRGDVYEPLREWRLH